MSFIFSESKGGVEDKLIPASNLGILPVYILQKKKARKESTRCYGNLTQVTLPRGFHLIKGPRANQRFLSYIYMIKFRRRREVYYSTQY